MKRCLRKAQQDKPENKAKLRIASSIINEILNTINGIQEIIIKTEFHSNYSG